MMPNRFAFWDYLPDCKNMDSQTPESQRFQFRRSAGGPGDGERQPEAVFGNHWPQRIVGHVRAVTGRHVTLSA